MATDPTYANLTDLLFKIPLKKQMVSSEFTENFEDLSGGTSSTLLILLVVMVVINQVFPGGMRNMTQLIRYLQLIVHLPLNRILFPSQTILFASNVISVAMYDVLGLFNVNVDRLFVYGESIEVNYKENQTQQVQNIGYGSPLAIKNLGSIGTFLVLYFVKVAIYALLSLIMRIKFIQRLQPLHKFIGKGLFFGELIIIIQESCVELLISTQIEFEFNEGFSSENSLSGNKISRIISVTCICLIVFYFFSYYWIKIQDKKTLASDDFTGAWGEEYNTENHIHYNLVFVLRRVFLVQIAF